MNRFRPLLLPCALVVLLLLANAPAARAVDLSAGSEAELATAIATVNAAGAGTHTITLTAGITLTEVLPVLANADADELVLDGAGHTLTGDGAHTILTVGAGTTARFDNLTLTGGQGSSGPGGANGGAVFMRGRLTIEDSALTGNAAARGGAIFVLAGPGKTAELTLQRVTLGGNTATQEGGALTAVGDQGEAIVLIEDSTLAENAATTFGGAIGGSALTGVVDITLRRVTALGNGASYGGALYVHGNAGETRVTVEDSALSVNEATTRGGAAYLNGNNGLASLALLNSTLSGNSAGNAGGAISAVDNGGTAEATLRYVTVAANTAPTGSALHAANGGAITTTASILSAGGAGTACAGAITSGGYNLDDDGSCGLTQPGDLSDGNPALLPLALNAPGTTATHALDPASDAQQHIPTGTAGCGGDVTTDQRGSPRPTPAGQCDIGAYESDHGDTPVCDPPYNPATAAELSAAIACVNAGGAGQHTINLTAGITLTAATPALNNPAATLLLIDGNGHTLDGDGHGPVLSVAAGTTALVRELTLTGGAAGAGAGIRNDGVLTVEASRLTGNVATGDGGGILSRGRLTIKGSTLDANSAAFGGGVAMRTGDTNVTLTIQDSTVRDNTAGGGIQLSAEGQVATVSLKNVTLSDNQSAAGAGGLGLRAGAGADVNVVVSGARWVTNSGTVGGGLAARAEGGSVSLNLSKVFFDRNSATDGGGLSLSAAGSGENGGTVEALLTQSTLVSNAVTNDGGGIHSTATAGGTASLTLFNTTLSANRADGAGGGLYTTAVGGGAAGSNIVYTTLADNQAVAGGGGVNVGGSASVLLTSTIIYNGPGASADCVRSGGSLISTGYNLAGDGTCFLTQGNDLPATNPGLLPLTLNPPGATPTHALSAGSVALDRVHPGAAGCGTAITSDQRGAPRPQAPGGMCDVGAFERAETSAPDFNWYLPVAVR